MSDRNAYEGEMRLRRPYDTDDPEFSSLAEEVRSACLGAPGPEVQARHIQAIVEQARRIPEVPTVASGGVGRRSRPLGVLARLGAAAAILALLTGSLALAGVDLPILPDGTSDDSPAHESRPEPTREDATRSETAEAVQAAIRSSLPMLKVGDLSGCEFGAMVSAAARGVEPDTSGCEKSDSGEDEEPGAGRSETAQRVQAAIEVNLPLLHAGGISGCEFGAMVSAAAHGVEPDTSRCEKANLKAGADQTDSKAAKQKGSAAAEPSAPNQNTSPKQSHSKKEAAEGGAAGSSNEPGAKANKQGKTKAKGNDKGDVKAPGQGKGKGPPAGKPGGSSNGD
jgi:hypothetical protein